MRTKLIGILVLLLLAGCSRQSYMDVDRMNRGLVIVLSGIEGTSPLTKHIAEGLEAGGVDCAIEIHDWANPWSPLYNLRAEDRNREKAAKLAGKIQKYREEFPSRNVILIGHSGGGAIATWTAEVLAPGLKADGIIMLAPALSPEYLLDLALSNLRLGIVNFYSGRDNVFLGLGTTIYGTMDGEHTSSAGYSGFKVPASGKPAGYDRLFQVPWRKEMARTGNFGGHLSSSAADFVATYVAPLVLADQWDEELIEDVIGMAILPEQPKEPETQESQAP